LVEFKPVFEFICLISFEKFANRFLFLPKLSFFQPSYPLQPSTAFPAAQLALVSSSAQLVYPAAQPTYGLAGPHRLLSPRLADGWGPVVIPDLRPDPEPHPGSAPELDPTVPAAHPRNPLLLGLARQGRPAL
jgi:hypothetical protein